MTETEILDKHKYYDAIALLKLVLTESCIENEFDEQIYRYLKSVKQLPEDYIPYFLNVETDGGGHKD